MARCRYCSAPLLANTNRCRYCNVRNDVDLQGKTDTILHSETSQRICPHCDIALHTITLNLSEPFYIERCEQCFGLFFDPGEIETLLNNRVSPVFDVNLELIKHINQDRYQSKRPVKYLKCPVCRVLMNRVNFAHRSGVIVDRCHAHGIWLENGEITHLMEWKKAGGELLHQQRQAQQKTASKPTAHLPPDFFNRTEKPPKSLEAELGDTLSELLFKLFD